MQCELQFCILIESIMPFYQVNGNKSCNTKVVKNEENVADDQKQPWQIHAEQRKALFRDIQHQCTDKERGDDTDVEQREFDDVLYDLRRDTFDQAFNDRIKTQEGGIIQNGLFIRDQKEG